MGAVVRLTAFALVVLALPVSARAGLDPSRLLSQYRHTAWTVTDGLPQSTIISIVQDDDGYLWLATQGGLARFDGVRFTVFDRRNTPGLRDNFARVLHQDRHHAMWIGTETGGVTRYQNGTFSHFGREHGLPHATIRAITEDRQGVLWVATRTGLAHFRDERFHPAAVPCGRLYSVEAAADGGLWIGTPCGVFRRTREGRIDRLALPGTPETARPLAGTRPIYEDKIGRLWVSLTCGLYRFTVREGKAVSGEQVGTGERAVLSIVEDTQGTVWLATRRNGVQRVRGGTVDSFGVAEGLTDERVLATFEDREGSLWIGTEGGGLNRLSNVNAVSVGEREGLPANTIWTVAQSRDGAMWLGTDGGGVTRFKDGQLTTFDKAHGLPDDSVIAIIEARDRSLWFGTYVGLSRFADGRFTNFSVGTTAGGNAVLALLEDRDGTVWVGTNDGIVHVRNGVVSRFGADHLSGASVWLIQQHHDGSIWVATSRGLFVVRGDTLRRYSHREGLPDFHVRALHADADGSVWVGTDGGGLLHYRDGVFTSVGATNTALPASIGAILEDDRGTLWLGTLYGIHAIAKQALLAAATTANGTFEVRTLGRAEGMRSTEVHSGMQPVACKSGDGRLWFATPRGVVVIDPSRIRKNEVPPPVHIEEVLLDREVRVGHDLVAPVGRGELEFRYTALSMLDPAKVAFKYRLEGFDTKWIDAGTRRVAYYTNIPPGEYRFRVIASNNDDVWNEQGAGVGVKLSPHFYQTRPFLGAGFTTLAAFVLWAHRLRVRHLKAREQRLAVLVERRTSELAAANLQLERLAVLDPLTGLANRRRCEEFLGRQWKQGARTQTPVSLLMIDVDFFKSFNDALGHPAGDGCLRRLGEVLAASFQRPGDLVVRYGGEEFLVLLSDEEPSAAVLLAERAAERIRALHIHHPASLVADHVTVSIGVASALPTSQSDYQQLVSAADAALYEAKRQGRNRVVISRQLLGSEPELAAAYPSATGARELAYDEGGAGTSVSDDSPPTHSARVLTVAKGETAVAEKRLVVHLPPIPTASSARS